MSRRPAHNRPSGTATREQAERRKRLDSEHHDLIDPETGVVLASYGPSLITVIFNAETLVDPTLFFISGGHLDFVFISREDEDGVLDVRFVNPRVPTYFTHLLPTTTSTTEERDIRGQDLPESSGRPNIIAEGEIVPDKSQSEFIAEKEDQPATELQEGEADEDSKHHHHLSFPEEVEEEDPCEDPKLQEVVEEENRGSTAAQAKRKRGGQRTRKRCAFFTMLVTRKGRLPGEAETVHLAADVKLFHYTTHVCGLRNAEDAALVMRFICEAFTKNQIKLDKTRTVIPRAIVSRNSVDQPDIEEDAEGSSVAQPSVSEFGSVSRPRDEERRLILDELSGGNSVRRAFLESNSHCCSLPLTISEGDVVMTNMCGKWPSTLNLRATYRALSANYPGVLSYLTTMSKSNYLVVTLFEHAPFEPILNLEEVLNEGGRAMLERIKHEKHTYLMSSKRMRSKLRKHTFFVYASGRFIQSSRNNATALSYTIRCMKLLHSVSSGIASPSPFALDDESEDGGEAVGGDDYVAHLRCDASAADNDEEDFEF